MEYIEQSLKRLALIIVISDPTSITIDGLVNAMVHYVKGR